MTKQEITAILKIIKVSYPNFYKDLKKDDADELLNVWSTMFANDDPMIVTEAVKALIATLKFPPTIADVKEKIKLLTAPEILTEMEAWRIVFNGICCANYHSQEYFNDMPIILQKIVGSAKQLREWATLDPADVQTVVQSNFMRSFKIKSKYDEDMSLIPNSTKLLIQNLYEPKKLI